MRLAQLLLAVLLLLLPVMGRADVVLVQQSTAYTIPLHIYANTDGRTGLTGQTGNAYIVRLNGSAGTTAKAASTNTITEVDSANSPGLYTLTLTTTEDGTLGFVDVYYKSASSDPVNVTFKVVAYNPDDSVRMGLTALPNAAAGANGGLPLGDASGRVDLGRWLGSAPDALSSGKLPADVKLWLTAAPAALSTNGYVQTMLLRWLTDNAGGTPSALIAGRTDANTQATAAALTFGLTGNITGNLSGSVGSVTGAVGSVTGAVGSVTGNIGGISGVTLPATVPSLAQIEAGILVTSTQPIATDASGRVLLQPTQTGVTIPTVTTLTTTPSDSSGVTTLLTRIPGTVQPQTGDSYARLGAPAGASVSADIAANLTAVNTRAATSALPTNFSALSITAGGLVAINLAQALGASPWDTTTIGDSFKAGWTQGVGKWVVSTTDHTLKLYAPDGTTVLKSFAILPVPTVNASRQ